MTDYTCAWEISLICDTPQEAARLAESLMSKRQQSCWTVIDETDGQQWRIEAMEPEAPLPATFKCQNCEATFSTAQELSWIKRLTERVAPSEPMPAGECPECGALVHEETTP